MPIPFNATLEGLFGHSPTIFSPNYGQFPSPNLHAYFSFPSDTLIICWNKIGESNPYRMYFRRQDGAF